MRVTNSMISNSSANHIANAKHSLMTAEDQYTTQKKIQRPSDDPTVAVRSLQLRTTYTQLNQYVEKNVKDAMSWMDTTESALKNINSILTNMKGYLNQGANDPLDTDERKSVLSVLQEYARAIFEDEANTDYSGRYVFAGRRTDTSLLFPDKTTNLEYEITEKLSSSAINSVKYVSGESVYNPVAGNYDTAAQSKAYHMQLAYDNCADSKITGGLADPVKIQLNYGTTNQALTVKTMKSTDADAYDAAKAGTDAIYLYDTGEVIFSENAYQTIQSNDAEIEVTYAKKEFEKSDIRPEMYFGCVKYDKDKKQSYTYAEPKDQTIDFEVGFSQQATVNTQARDAISTDIYRTIDYIAKCVDYVNQVDTKISEVEKQLSNTTDKTEIERLEKLKELLKQEKGLREDVMTEAFGMGLTMVDRTQELANVALADLGSRYNRLQLTFDKLSDQRVDTEEKLSENEDINIADAYINLSQADNLYQASLQATSKILGNSLLNYI